MTELEWLADIVRRVPVLHVDIAEAKASADADRVAYARAMARWTDEAALAVAEAEAAASRREGVGSFRSGQLWGNRPSGELPSELVPPRFSAALLG